MRKAALVLVPFIVAVLCIGASAQAPDLKFVGAKVGLITYLDGGIPFGASFEMPLKAVNPNLTGGAQFMYQSWTTSYGFFDATYSDMLISVFGAYYVDVLKMDKLKTYGKLHLGYRVESVTLKSTSPWFTNGAVASGSEFLFAFNVGAKYMITSNFAGTVELGYGISVLQLGLEYGF